LLDDLGERFNALVAAAPEGTTPPTTLAEFLKTLAESFPGNGTSPAPARRPLDASKTQGDDDEAPSTGPSGSTTTPKPAAAGVTSTALASVAPDASPAVAPAPASSGLRLVSAQFDLKEVLSYSSNGSTLSYSASLRSQLLFASA
jgi:hypothetical protein